MARYSRPTSRAEALATLASEGGGARPLVGGTDLLVALRHHTVEPSVIVDLKAITDLPDPLVVREDGITVGPTATMTDLATHPTIRSWYPGLVEAALTVGSVAIRNRASLVGNMCNGSPAADTAPPLLVAGASVTIASGERERTIPLSSFFLGPRRTECGLGELVIALHLPRPEERSSSAVRRLTRRRGVDLATVSVAAAVDAEDRIVLGLGAVGPRPILTRIDQAVDLADDRQLTEVLDEQLRVATPISDVRASQEYRSATIRVLAKRAVHAAADRRTATEMAS